MSHTLRNSPTLLHASFVALAFAGTFGVARTASAQEACGDTECPKGYQCETVSGACPDIACITMDGADCKPCEPVDSYVCTPAACKTDDDCGAHMKCAPIEVTECQGDATSDQTCAKDETCTPTAAIPPTCTTTTLHECRPQWTLPCAEAADCGAGFTCEEQESCWCSGSSGTASGGSVASTGSGAGGGTGTAGGGNVVSAGPNPSGEETAEPDVAPTNPEHVADTGVAAPPPPEDSCGCEPTGEFACEAKEVECTADSDCPTDWTCVDNPSGACWADSHGNTGCTPADPAKLCTPPYSDLPGRDLAYAEATGGGTGSVVLDDGTSSNPNTDSGASGTTDPKSGPDVQAPAPAEDPDATETDGEHVADPVVPADDAADDDSAAAADPAEGAVTNRKLGGGGCTVSSGSTGDSSLALLFGAGLAAALGLRRRRSSR